ncbi:outer membrane lipoprotein carrier protein LolA [candidate division KSB1 bacterium]
MNKFKFLIVIFLSGLLSVTSSYGQELSEDEIGQVLKKMITAQNNFRYTGDVTEKRIRDNQLRIYNKKIWIEPPNCVREEINVPERNRKIVKIFNNGKLETKINGKSFFSLRRRPSKPRFEPLKRMRRNFDINISDDKIIAGRETELIIMTPKKKNGRNIRFWIDKKTGVTLKKEILTLKDKNFIPIYEMCFTNIDYEPPKNPELFRIKREMSFPNIETKEYATLKEARESIRFPLLIPDYIPDGYQLDRIRTTRERRSVTVHLNYNNGVNSFSVFQTRGHIPPYFGRTFKKDTKNNIIEIDRENRTIFFRKMGTFNLTIIGNCKKELIRTVLENFSLPEKP